MGDYRLIAMLYHPDWNGEDAADAVRQMIDDMEARWMPHLVMEVDELERMDIEQ